MKESAKKSKKKKKKTKTSLKSNEQKSRELELDRDDLLQDVAVDYNNLLDRISSSIAKSNLNSVQEIRRSAVALEESYLWFRCAVEKAEPNDHMH